MMTREEQVRILSAQGSGTRRAEYRNHASFCPVLVGALQVLATGLAGESTSRMPFGQFAGSRSSLLKPCLCFCLYLAFEYDWQPCSPIAEHMHGMQMCWFRCAASSNLHQEMG